MGNSTPKTIMLAERTLALIKLCRRKASGT